MKRIVYCILFLVLMSSVAFSQGQGVHEPGTGIEQPELREANMGTGKDVVDERLRGQPEQIDVTMLGKGRGKAQSVQELRGMITQRRVMLNNEANNLSKGRSQAVKNQNSVRLAVHSLLAMEDLVGGIGPQVREIARNFNNSVQATINAEERIQNRGSITRFFSGGDAKAAQDIEERVNQNQQRIQEMEMLTEECDCDPEVKEIMREQASSLRNEQSRLNQLAKNEKARKGILGWIWK